MFPQLHVSLVIDVIPDPNENPTDLAVELSDALKSVSMEYGLIRHSECKQLERGDEGYVDSDATLAPQVA